jgi:hypothetical protein
MKQAASKIPEKCVKCQTPLNGNLTCKKCGWFHQLIDGIGEAIGETKFDG